MHATGPTATINNATASTAFAGAGTTDRVPAAGLSAARADIQAQLAQLAGRQRNKHPMVSDLAHASIRDAAALARATWEPMGLYPANPAEVNAVIEAIEAWAGERDIYYLLDIDADRMLRDLADVKSLDGRLTHGQLDKLHLIRNTLTALRGTMLFVRDSTDRRRSDRPARDRLDAGLPELPNRFAQRSRPLTDDEVLLSNILVEIDLLENAEPLPIAAYLVAESGIRTMESCAVTTEHLDDRHEPRAIAAKGVWGWPPRTIELDDHAANALARVLACMPDGHQRLTYKGGSPGTKEGSASLNPVIERFLRRAGIADTDAKAKSLALTRPYRILRLTENFKAAKKVHGGKTHNMLTDFNCTLNDDTLYEGKVHVIDAHGDTIARVDAGHLYDPKAAPRSVA
ncbi:hypothetical protein [Nocardioides abyssi]|uniref:Integrase n=1 Tax=Nocardioides abyssi TaxID=3058370 RepID=A0ABT8EQY6_9ACTN|nr:hypothetical protein [Nocardioides abyssi]MDN4160421.1 hypothetical protein [Nocardioides abyssi]